MRTIIAGSRDGGFALADVAAAVAAVAAVGGVSEVVSGGARGVDRLGEAWAELHRVPVRRFPADWARFGRSAGFRRNLEMAAYADCLVALWDGRSPGTRHMVAAMRRAGKPVFVYRPARPGAAGQLGLGL